ncbi:NAD-dependent epimerase/dehydratase family protein [Candidatus Dojkabacteria bacterium]|uniref:NAD-dependent epimerase/dehydratase family protein n=1 Tax=Candidatus Dojkabacteria bacterium TaxID=2099670 RepID=A0A955RH87_9BACT|nr:NAD-dependent epimerase/dehydratase family protein [Candidatus Dojkabacteria bacterium]
MTLKEKLEKNKKNPVALICNGISGIGIELSKALIEQGALVIMVEFLNKDKLSTIEELENNDKFSLLDIKGLSGLPNELKTLDYIYYFQLEEGEDKIKSSDFLENAALLESVLNIALEKESKFTLVDSIHLNRIINSQDLGTAVSKRKKTYTHLEIQRYSENLVEEYIDKNKLIGTIIRIGEVYGPGVLEEESKVLNKMIDQAIKEDDITVNGEGLEEHYFVYITDAVFGLLKAQFSDETKGKIFALADPDEVTELSLAYTLIDLEFKADEVEFSVDKNSQLLDKDTTPNLTEIGWTPKVSLARGIKQTADALAEVSKEIKTPAVKLTDKKEGGEIEEDTKQTNLEDVKANNVEEEKNDKDENPQTKSNSIMDIFGKKQKKAVLDKGVPEEDKDSRLKRVSGLKKKQKVDKKVEKKAKERSEIGTTKGKAKSVLKVAVIIFLIGAYFLFFAPLIKYTYNMLSLNKEVNKLTSKSLNENMSNDELIASFVNIDSYLQNQAHSLNLPYITGKLLNQETIVNKILRDSNNYRGIVSDMKDIALYRKAMEDYLSQLEFTSTGSGDSASINQKGSYKAPATNLSLNEAVSDLATRTILLEKDDFVVNTLIENFVKLDKVNSYASGTLAEYELLSNILGLQDKSVNLIMISDDQSEASIGGNPLGFIRLEFEDSKLTNIKLSDYESFSKYVDSPDFWKKNDNEAIQASYFKTLSNEEELFNTVSTAYENFTKVKIDNLIIVNLSFLEDITDLGQSLKLGETAVSKSNLRETINSVDFSTAGQFILADLLTFGKSKNDLFYTKLMTAYSDGDVNYLLGSNLSNLKDEGEDSANDIEIDETSLVNTNDVKIQREKNFTMSINDDLVAEGKLNIIYKSSSSAQADDSPDTTAENPDSTTTDKATNEEGIDIKEYVNITLPSNYKIVGVKGITDVNEITANSISGIVDINDDRIVVSVEFETKVPSTVDNSVTLIKQNGLPTEYLGVKLSTSGEKYTLSSTGLIKSDDTFTYSGAFTRDVSFTYSVK